MRFIVFPLLLCCFANVQWIVASNQQESRQAAAEFAKIVMGMLNLANGPLPTFLGVGELFTNLMHAASGVSEGDLWTQIEARVQTKIGQALAGYHLSDIKSDFRLFASMIAKNASFDKDDLDYIMAKKLRMMPQNFPSLGFTSQLVTLVPAWTAYMIAGKLQLIAKGQQSKCDVASELGKVREETIQAAKSLLRKRIENVDGTGFYRGSPDKPICASIPCHSMARFKFVDGTTKQEYDVVMGEVMSGVFYKLIKNTMDFIEKYLIVPMNNYFNHKICLSGCSCPSPIAKSEYAVYFRTDCFGKTEKGPQCSLPCQAYGSGSNWCPYFSNHRLPSNNLLFLNGWQNCEPADFDKCMPIKEAVM